MTVTPRAKLLCLAACLLWAFPLCAEMPPRAELITAKRIGTTPPMASYLATHHPAPNAPVRVFPVRKPSSHPGKGNGGNNGGGSGSSWTDGDLQTTPLSQSYTIGGVNIYGITSVGYVPPDTNISVGNGQVVETVNVDYAVYSTADGSQIQAPAAIHTIFAAAGGSSMCSSVDGGDPIVLYDKIDQVWIISQLAYNNGLSNNHLCLAISHGANAATDKYTAYDISFGKNFPDYPKMGIWAAGSSWTSIGQAGVYISANMFAHGSSFIGAEMLGFPLSDVEAVKRNNPPSQLHLAQLQNGTSVYNILPADLEGNPYLTGSTNPAPAGTDEYFMEFTGTDTLTLYQFKPDFNGGTGAISNQKSIQVNNPFHEACGGGACIPQLGTSTQLDSLGDRLMYRLSYRNYGSNGQSMVVTHSVQMDSSSNATGVRWYQLTATGATTTSGWGIGQEGTFGSTDGTYRWMGSIAQDKVGDLGIGYSVSGPKMFPDIAYTGQNSAKDGAGLLEQEHLLNVGAGYQNSVNRWGDYSSMSVDPSNDCTMWYANEYLKSNGSYTNWGTEITNFSFSNCTSQP